MHCSLQSWYVQEGAVGPHPAANLEVLFTRHRFTHMLSYMTFHVAPIFSTLVHELTADQARSSYCTIYSPSPAMARSFHDAETAHASFHKQICTVYLVSAILVQMSIYFDIEHLADAT